MGSRKPVTPALRGASSVLLAAVFFVFVLLPISTSAQASAGDAAAMRAVANALGADKSLGWTLADDPCTWRFVICSDDRVTAIQVGNRSLSGSLAPEVHNLTALARLELQQNQIGGPLPSLAGLSTLQVLLLHDNLFTSIPDDFFTGLSALQEVYLDKNPFAPWEIPETLKDASTLVNFSANSANVTGTVPDSFGDSFPGLSHLALALNMLHGAIPSTFGNSSIQSLWLNSQRGNTPLSGTIEVIQSMMSLTQLWLQSNAFSGPLPDFSGLTALQDLQLRDNRFTGPVPRSLTSLPSLRRITLTNNLLQGPVPVFPATVTQVDVAPATESFCLDGPGDCDSRVSVLLLVAKSFGYPEKFAEDWKGNDPCTGWLGIGCDTTGNITTINFQRMGLSGTISPDFASFRSLQKLLLSNNNISGTIPPTLAGMPNLRELDVSNNSIYGQVPAFSSSVLVRTSGNPDIGKNSSGAPSPASNAPSGSDTQSPRGSSDNGSIKNRSSSSSVGVIVGSVIGTIFGLSLIAALGFCWYKRKQQGFGRVQSPNTIVVHPRHSGSDRDLLKITVAGSTVNGEIGTTAETLIPTRSGPSDIHMVETGNMLISIQVLRNVTNNFSEENILGRGGFGTVYKGELHDGTKIAVKRMESGVMGSKGLTEFKSEIAVLTKVRHRNLVSLLGYCLDGNERLLVYEYMPQGTLSHHLLNWKEEGLKPLDWKKRIAIALDVARGVEYLHSLAHQSFIHRDLKPSNILLGDDMKAKVSDFGLVRLAPDGKYSVETRLAGTFGYLAPEYAVTGRVTTKADVFSFGVILMELITGRKALDESLPEESVHLVTWFRRMQLNKDAFRKAIDPTIDLDEESLASISTVSELAGHCCAREPHQRPDMGHAVNVLSSLAELWKPTDPESEESYGIDLDMTLPQALKKWQAFEDSSLSDVGASSFLASMDNTQTSIPTRPTGFADSFTSTDGR